MAKLDVYIKKLLQDRKIFADLYNAELFQGRQVLHAEDLTPIPNESGIVTVNSRGGTKIIQRYRDKVMKTSFGAALAIMAAEGQGEVHYGMPVRNMTYDALDYTEQIEELEKQHKEVGDLSGGAEFLSRIAKKDRLVPIITLVLYYGKKPWDGPCSLYEMMGVDDTWDGFEEIKEYLPSYRIHVVDVRNIKELNRYQTGLQQVFGMLKYNSDKQKFYDYARNNREAIRNLDDNAMAMMLALLGEQKRLMEILKSSKGKEEKDVCVAIDELIEDGRAEGKVEGKIEGKAEGKAEGKTEGIATAVLELLQDLGEYSDSLRDKILRQREPDTLKKWLRLASRSETIEMFQNGME